MPPVISVEHLSKSYRLGQIDTGNFSRDQEVGLDELNAISNPAER